MPIAIATASEPWRPVDIVGEGLVIIVLGAVFSFLSVLVVILRIYVRVTIRCFGIDDLFMCIGTIFALVHNAAAIWGGISGLGTVDHLLTVKQSTEANKAVFLWEITINFAFGFVKTSICCALMRLTAGQRVYRVVIWILIVFTWAMNAWEIIASATTYHPDTEICTDYDNLCDNFTATSFVGLQFAVFISVDAACTLLPVFLLWNLQMGTREKVSTSILLGLGSLATIASIVRLPLSLKFNYVDNRLYHRGQVIIWTIVEVNVGIVAGSMPAIRKLFRWLAEDFSWVPKTSPKRQRNQYNLGTIRQMVARSGPTRLRTPNNEIQDGCGNQDHELSRRSGHLEDHSRDLKGFATISDSDTNTATLVLSRNETIKSVGSLIEDRSEDV